MRHRVAAKLKTHFLAVVAALATAPALGAADNAPTGRWFTEGFEKGIHLQVILDLRPGGFYAKDIRIIENCEIAANGKETGKWTFERGNLATVSETFDGKPATGSTADTHNVFSVSRVDGEHINFFDTDTKLNWALMMVSASDPFPAPRGCGI
jgi:hypothetical protein